MRNIIEMSNLELDIKTNEQKKLMREMIMGLHHNLDVTEK